MQMVKFSVKKQYKRSNRSKEELILALLKSISKEEQQTSYQIEQNDGIGVDSNDLKQYLQYLTEIQAISQLEQLKGRRKVKYYTITEKGHTLLLKYDILLSLLPSVWRTT